MTDARMGNQQSCHQTNPWLNIIDPLAVVFCVALVAPVVACCGKGGSGQRWQRSTFIDREFQFQLDLIDRENYYNTALLVDRSFESWKIQRH